MMVIKMLKTCPNKECNPHDSPYCNVFPNHTHCRFCGTELILKEHDVLDHSITKELFKGLGVKPR